MREFFLSVVIGTTLMISGMHGATIPQRPENQQHRIARGVASGQLTARETAQLERRETAIHREIRRDRADGRFTPRERARVQQRRNAVSRQIYRDKHNRGRQ